MNPNGTMADSENIRKAREALARADALAEESKRLRQKSERLAEEMEVLQRAERILRSRAEDRVAE